MTCKNCGFFSNDSDMYCANCGTRLESVNTQAQPYPANNNFNPTNPTSVKKRTNPVIIAIAAVTIVLLIAITTICVFFMTNKKSQAENVSVNESTQVTQSEKEPVACVSKTPFDAGATCKVNDISGHTGLSLRSGPSKGYDRITIVPNGAVVVTLADYTDANNGYTKVRYESYEGWVLVSELHIYEGNKSVGTTAANTEKTTVKVPSSDEMTVEKARGIFQNCMEIFEKYYVNRNMSTEIMINAYNKRTGQEESYGLVESGTDSIDGIYNELHKYMSDKMCKYVTDSCYIEQDGKLYHHTPVFGLEGTFVVTNEEVYKSGDKWVYKVTSAYKEMDSAPTGAYNDEFELIYEDGNWVVEAFNEHHLSLEYK